MLDINLKLAAEEFVRYLMSTKEIKEFRSARDKFITDPEVSEKYLELTQRAQNFKEKQIHGSVTQEEIDTIKQLQKEVNNHLVTQRYIQKQQEMVVVLKDCSGAISELLGFDFSATAAPGRKC